MIFMGVDSGSLTCDAVLVDRAGQILSWAVVPTGARNRVAIQRVREAALGQAGLDASQVSALISTGYGRNRVPGRLAAVTEITCHARGVQASLPGTQVLVDIGGQDSKALRLDGQGRVLDFAMNDKCAAGTGRFLEVMARALEVDLEDWGALDAQATSRLTLSSMCTVFAESEVVSHLAEGADVAEIIRGLNRSIAARTVTLVRRVAPRLAGLAVAMSGGVARNPGVVRALSEALQAPISVPAEPDIMGALGAALIARDRTRAMSDG